MSKYEEALDELFMWATNGYCALEYGDENYVRLKAVMQELVGLSTPNYRDEFVEDLLNRIDDLESEIDCWEQRYDELKEDYERVCKAHRG